MDYNISPINSIKDIFIRNKQTLAVAESVTSGHLQAALSLAESASGFFQGGITVYNVGQKTRHLNVEPIHALSCNCVSEHVAVQMAKHVNKLFLTDYGIAVTGFATKAPDMNINVLYAYMAITMKDKIILTQKLFPNIDGEGYDVQVDYTNQIIDKLFSLLK